MKQIKKTLCTLALGLFGVLAVNAQKQTEGNLVKNETFRKSETDTKGTKEHWSLKSSAGTIKADGGGETARGHDFCLLVNGTDEGDYVFQKIEGLNATNYEFLFDVQPWYNDVKVQLVWSTAPDEVVEVWDSRAFVNDIKSKVSYPDDYAYDTWYPKDGNPLTETKKTGTIPTGATWVEIRFVTAGSMGDNDPDFYIDNVIFKTSGTPIVDPLGKPQNLKVADITTEGAKLTWDAVTDATSYQVKINGQTYTATTNSYDVTGLSAGTKYSVEVKGYSEKTKDKDNKKSEKEFFTLSKEKADGTDIFFDGGDFENGISDVNKGWMSNSAVSTDNTDVEDNATTKMRIQNSGATIVRSYDFSVEGNKKYTISAMAKSPEEGKNLRYYIRWKTADGANIGGLESVGETEGTAWQTIANELVAPQDAVIAEVQFQLPSGADNLVFYVDDVKVIKGVVAPKVEIKDVHQRNAKVSYMGIIKDKTYEVTLNGEKITLLEGGYIYGLKPATEYTVEVYRTDIPEKKVIEKFTTEEITNSTPIAHLSNIDAGGNVAQEFFYNIVDLEGDEVESVKVTYNGNPIEVKDGKIKLSGTKGGKLEVEITQKGGATTTLTYYTVNFK